MKVVLISRGGDFGVLEQAWDSHPLLLPVWGRPLIERLQEFFVSLGAAQGRLVCNDGPVLLRNSRRLADHLSSNKKWGDFWSMRSFSPLPTTPLTEILADQRMFWEREKTLVWSAPVLPLEPILGSPSPAGFPTVAMSAFLPGLLNTDGRLEPWNQSPVASLAGPRDFYQTHMRLLAVAPVQPTPLTGVDPRAILTAPLALAGQIHAKASSQVGPRAVLCPGVRIEPQASLQNVLVLAPVRIGRGLDLAGQIVVGNTLVGSDGGLKVIEDHRLLKAL